MYDVTLIYSPPLPLVTGEDTEYCGMNCLWRPCESDGEPEWVRVFLNVEEPCTMGFMEALNDAERASGTVVPPKVRGAIWEWFINNADYPGLEVRTATVVVE
jgi:hypothetical protein